MTQQEIVTEIHRRENLEYFRGAWRAFCQRVEDYAAKLYALEREAEKRYRTEWHSETWKKWREAQMERPERLRQRAELAADRDLQRHDEAYEDYRKAIQEIHPAWAGLAVLEVFSLLKSVPLSDEDRQRLVRCGVRVEELHRSYFIGYGRAHKLGQLADIFRYSSRQRPKDQMKPGHVWTDLFEERHLTAYLQVAPEHRQRSEIPELWIGVNAFWRPAELSNPAAWFRREPAPAVDLDDEGQFLHDAVILCVAHHQAHKDDTGAKRVIPPGEYQGTHFLMWAFVNDLEKNLTDAKVIEAWNGIQARLPQSPPKAKEAEGNGKKPQQPDCSHSADYTSVTWYGEQLTFNETQAACVKALWAEWEKNPDGKAALHQKTIRDTLTSENADFRLIHVFRYKGKLHPAWGRMIHSLGNGRFYLSKPTEPSTSRKPAKRKPAKTRKKSRIPE